jgi:hypothetical protein
VQTPSVASIALRRSVPRRGAILPRLDGVDRHGHGISTRDCYMRRNLAVIVAGRNNESSDWIESAAEVAEEAASEVGQVVLIVPPEVDSHGLPAILDTDGTCRDRLGLSPEDLPALFITDRFGVLFVASRGEDADADLSPRDIPRWLEFIACRCT